MAKIPEMTPIKSSAMTGYHYDPTTRELHVEFRPGSIYRYEGVTAEKAEAMMGNQSPGSYFAANIRNTHKATKV